MSENTDAITGSNVHKGIPSRSNKLKIKQTNKNKTPLFIKE